MDRIQTRFNELAAMADAVAASMNTREERREHTGRRWISTHRAPETRVSTTTVYEIDSELLVQWQTSVLALLSKVFGVEDPTYLEFQQALADRGQYPHPRFKRLRSVFQSAKNQFEGGYLFDVRNLVHASVFTDEIEQAKHFLDQGFKVPAAVIAGTVLESTMREMCSQHPNLVPGDNINKMNDDLARETIINDARKKQITAWAAIRNYAAHGKPEEFEPSEVDRMIEGIRDFVAAQMN